MTGPLVSVIIPTYRRPRLLAYAVASIDAQTYPSIELVVVNNGGGEEVTASVAGSWHRRRPPVVVEFVDNIWSWEDYVVYYTTVYRAGVEAASGEFVLIMSDDDAVSENYFDCMVRLLTENPRCVGAMGRCVNRNCLTGETWSVAGDPYARARFIDGQATLLNGVSPDSAWRVGVSDPGFGYVVRRSNYLRPDAQDGIWRGYEFQQLVYIAPFGELGYDPDASFFWGRHPDQGNLRMNAWLGAMTREITYEAETERLALAFWERNFGALQSLELARRFHLRRAAAQRTTWQRIIQGVGLDGTVPTLALAVMTLRVTDLRRFMRTDARKRDYWLAMLGYPYRAVPRGVRRMGLMLIAKPIRRRLLTAWQWARARRAP